MREVKSKIRVLMVGTDSSTRGGMWTVANNYIGSELYNSLVSLKYIPTFITGTALKRFFFALWGYFRIFFLLIKLKPQIVHVHVSERGSVYRKGVVICLAKIFNCKVVIHMHGAEFQVWYESLSERKKRRVRAIISRGDVIIILGEYWKKFISTIAPEVKVEIVYNAVPHNDYSYNPDGKTLLFLGVIGKRKGVYDLVKSFESVENRLPHEIKLVFYGPDFEQNATAIIKNSTSKKISYKGWLDDLQKKEVFKDVICNILPSYNEGLPMTILETMSMGIPNISTNIAAIPEVIDDSNGGLIEPGDIDSLGEMITKICSDREYRILLSNNAYKLIEDKFTIEENVKKILSIYEKILL